VIGPNQSGKSLLLHLYRQFLEDKMESEKVTWKRCNVDLLNDGVGYAITDQELTQYEILSARHFAEISWIVF
jgi:ABC-type cobalamin/Fe3+-siderophores transport system ATPase subunit